jgi:hypothetical protein
MLLQEKKKKKLEPEKENRIDSKYESGSEIPK